MSSNLNLTEKTAEEKKRNYMHYLYNFMSFLVIVVIHRGRSLLPTLAPGTCCSRHYMTLILEECSLHRTNLKLHHFNIIECVKP